LIEHHAQHVGTAVEKEPIALDRRRAKGGVRDRVIEKFVAFSPQVELHVDHVR
jgi:hypothetical protein